jgi:hypothetical protein
MADDFDDTPVRPEQISNLSQYPEFQAKQPERVMPKISSRQEAIDWMETFSTPCIQGDKYKIIVEKIYGEILYLTRKDFIDSHENYKITIMEGETPKQCPVSKLWLESSTRGEPRTIIFDPDPAVGFDKKRPEYNIWRGFAIKPIQADCTMYLEYVRNVICNGNEDHYHWLLSWSAQMLCEPHLKSGTSVVMRGGEGIGKSFYFETLGELISGNKYNMPKNDYYFKTSNPEHVTGKFNDHLAHVILLLLEEAFWAGDQRGAHVLRDIVTGTTGSSGQKFQSTKTVNNYVRVGINGNEDWLVPAAMDSRRFFVLDVSDVYKSDEQYWNKMHQWINNGGREALMYFFLNYNFKDVNLRLAPVTDALIDQRVSTMKSEDSFWMDLLRTGAIPYVTIDGNGYVTVVVEVLFNLYCETMKRTIIRNRSLQSDFGIKMHSFMPKLENGRVVKGASGRPLTLLDKKLVGGKGKQKPAYIIPPLNICRELMNYKLGKSYNWDEPHEWQLIPDMSDGIHM